MHACMPLVWAPTAPKNSTTSASQRGEARHLQPAQGGGAGSSVCNKMGEGAISSTTMRGAAHCTPLNPADASNDVCRMLLRAASLPSPARHVCMQPLASCSAPALVASLWNIRANGPACAESFPPGPACLGSAPCSHGNDCQRSEDDGIHTAVCDHAKKALKARQAASSAYS